MSHPGAETAEDTGLPKEFDSWSQEVRDKYWLEHVYKPHERQLTVRAVITGCLLGGVLSVANLYIGLKIGWSMGMAITSTILAFTVFYVGKQVGIVKEELTQLENNTVASSSSAAGYFSSAGMVSAIPALYLTTGRQLVWWELALWMLAVSFVGVLMAVPMRRQMIDVDRLKFPSGTACAETIRSMHMSAAAAVKKAYALMIGGTLAFWWELPAQVEKFGNSVNPIFWGGYLKFKFTGLTIAGKSLWAYGIGLPTSLLMYGSGAIMGVRVGLSLGIGSLILYGLLAPWLATHGVVVINDEGTTTYRSVLAWAVWPGVMGALAASLLQFVLKWRSIVSALGVLGKIAKKDGQANPMAEVEVPPKWFAWGMLAATALIVVAAKVVFDITPWMSLLATAMSFVLCIVACRATGETDVTPIGALGKITQLTFAAIHPGHYGTNLMTASITAGSASHSADLLTDLKTGYLLGGSPRRQFLAQFFGILAGGFFCVFSYGLVVHDPEKLGSSELPAPAAQTWAVVADLLANGVDSVDRGSGEAIGVSVQIVPLLTKPPGSVKGDTLRIKDGPNAGEYTIVGFDRKNMVLDRDLPVAEVVKPEDAEKEDAPQSFAAEVLTPEGAVRGGAVAVAANAGVRPGVRFTKRPDGTKVGDYLTVGAGDAAVHHQIKALRGDVAMLDHGFSGQAETPTTVAVMKSTLPPYAMTAVIVAMILGIFITLLDVYGPRAYRAYLPSVTGLGIAFVVNCFDSLAMTIGAVIAYVVAKTAPKLEEHYNIPLSSGIIAGSSLAGLSLIILSEIFKLLTLG